MKLLYNKNITSHYSVASPSSTYDNTHRAAIIYSQRQETDNIRDRDNIKTRDPESKSAKCTVSPPVPSYPGSQVLVAPQM